MEGSPTILRHSSPVVLEQPPSHTSRIDVSMPTNEEQRSVVRRCFEWFCCKRIEDRSVDIIQITNLNNDTVIEEANSEKSIGRKCLDLCCCSKKPDGQEEEIVIENPTAIETPNATVEQVLDEIDLHTAMDECMFFIERMIASDDFIDCLLGSMGSSGFFSYLLDIVRKIQTECPFYTKSNHLTSALFSQFNLSGLSLEQLSFDSEYNKKILSNSSHEKLKQGLTALKHDLHIIKKQLCKDTETTLSTRL